MSSGRYKLMKLLMHGPRVNKNKPQIREAAKKNKWNIVRGDKVQVIGKHPEKGKQGIVSKVIHDLDRVIVEGVNMGPFQIKGDPDRGVKGQILQKERTIHYSKVSLIDPVSGLPTRIYKKYLEDGTKVRVAKKSGAIIPRPAILTQRKKPVSGIITESDTLDEDAWENTYDPNEASRWHIDGVSKRTAEAFAAATGIGNNSATNSSS
mmetsp:Transcript_28057/g.39436  ORF Transcript_28057/g.39436 Transcript_28057/m.39436 type:complete len:207 (+) Transcript_28057:226-846(+)